MNILFLDQSGKPGGAELCLLDIARFYRDRCLVALFTDGLFRQLLEEQQISVQVLAAQPLAVYKDSHWLQGFSSIRQLLPLIAQVTQLSRQSDLIYANTQKALVVGAIASFLSQRPLIYHLHDILCADHFSPMNRRLAVTLANRFASAVIANSQASRTAFIEAGGRAELTEVIYNGFDPELYKTSGDRLTLRQQLGLPDDRFWVGHFSRLSPWKGQHILLEALTACPEDVGAIFVGDALFGEQEYVQFLQAQVQSLGLQERVRFLGFRSDIVPLMHVCDLVAHTSTAPEPFGRVIVEAMLCGRPVVAAQAGGAVELVRPDIDGWLVPPGNTQELAAVIKSCQAQPERAMAIAQQAQVQASKQFHLTTIHQQIDHLLHWVMAQTPVITPKLS